ncbi:MAG: transcriptional regulator PadR family [Clostridia bacterium]|jgi:hypothetical protein|nr:transcriptional regulator PadR family [Clostridia bacterium]
MDVSLYQIDYDPSYPCCPYTVKCIDLIPSQRNGLIDKEGKKVEGKIRKYYMISELGKDVLEEAQKKAYELSKEIKD